MFFIYISLNSSLTHAQDQTNLVYIFTKNGQITILLRPDLAPNNVARVKFLVEEGFYDLLSFHRVISGFMAQTGDPTGTGMGGSKLPNLPAEFSQTPFRRGTLGMARAKDPNSANSQFFICLNDAPFLIGNYTVIGEVISGMEIVDKIKKSAADQNGMVQNPDKIVKMQLAIPSRRVPKKPSTPSRAAPTEAKPSLPNSACEKFPNLC